MEYLEALKSERGGFTFDLSKRNQLLEDKKIVKSQQYTKTGTTIVGCIYKDGVVLGADTRATSGSIVAEKNCEKIDYMAPNIYCAGAGTAADTFYLKYLMASNMELMRLNTGRQTRISTAVFRLTNLLHRYQGNIGAALIVGGVDVRGPQICQISPEGTSSYLPFASMGSGSLAAIAILETKFRDNLTYEEARDLCVEAIEAGIYHDLGSGSNVDITHITLEKTEVFRNLKRDNKKVFEKPELYQFPAGTTPFLREFSIPLERIVHKSAVENKNEDSKMEIL